MIRKLVRDRKYQFAVVLFFSIYFIVGMSIYHDYGISADETQQHNLGLLTWEYVSNGDFASSPPSYDWDHGPAFQLFLTAVEKLMRLEDSREIFLMRHLSTFLLFFISVWFFYLICKHHFGDRKIALLGALFLILSPRIFADSFYNPKDLPFLSVFVICMYSLIRLSEKGDLLLAAAHALLCSFLIDIRITGVVMVAISLFALGSDLIRVRGEHDKSLRQLKLILGYLIVLAPATILFWPYLWQNPVINFIRAFDSMGHYKWRGYVLFFGYYFKGSELPWCYIPLWITVTTPLLYVLTFFAGLIVFLRGFIKNPPEYMFHDRQHRREVLFFVCFFLPLATVIALNSTLFNSWRHMFFIYPPFLLISLIGISSLFKVIRARSKSGSLLYERAFVGIIVLSLLTVSYSMIKNHPYQNLYFNELVPEGGEFLKSHFDLDYWNLTYKKAFEYILTNDRQKVIRVVSHNGKKNKLLLMKTERERLRFVEDPEDAEYYVTKKDFDKKSFPQNREFYSITVHGSRVLVVYKLR